MMQKTAEILYNAWRQYADFYRYTSLGEIITKTCSGCGSNVYVNCRRFNGILYMGKECICSDCKQKKRACPKTSPKRYIATLFYQSFGKGASKCQLN